jgi:two-component system, chemotaxis family, protein-glutamate methylesterase/glutaminase
MPVRAMIVDDSAVVRKHLADTLTAGGVQVIASASDPIFAWPKMQENSADAGGHVLHLDRSGL